MAKLLLAIGVLVLCVYVFAQSYGEGVARMEGMTSEQRYQAEMLQLEAQKYSAQSIGVAAVASAVAAVCIVAIALSFRAGQDTRQKHHDMMMWERSKRRPESVDNIDETQLMETGQGGQVTLSSIRKHQQMTRLIRETVRRTGDTQRENVMNAIRATGAGVDSNVFSPAWRECVEAWSAFAQLNPSPAPAKISQT